VSWRRPFSLGRGRPCGLVERPPPAPWPRGRCLGGQTGRSARTWGATFRRGWMRNFAIEGGDVSERLNSYPRGDFTVSGEMYRRSAISRFE
jgi:hypothetical protein